jgi:hypothetical protein
MVGLVSGLALVHAQEDGGESIVMYQSVLNLVVMVGLVSGLALVHAQEDGGESIVMYQSVLNSVFMESALLQKRAGALQDGKANSVLYQCVPDPVKMVVPA